MDQQKMWENNLMENSKVENAIAVAGFKAALLVGKDFIFRPKNKISIYQECFLIRRKTRIMILVIASIINLHHQQR